MQNGLVIRPYQTIFNTYLQVTMHNVVGYQVSTLRKTYMQVMKYVVRWMADRGLTLQSLSHDDLVGFHSRLECLSISSPCSSSKWLISSSPRMPQGMRIFEQPVDTKSGRIPIRTLSILCGL